MPSDEAAETAEVATEEGGSTETTNDEESRVPVGELVKERKKRQAYEAEAEALRKRIEEADNAKKSDVEKLTDRLQAAEKAAADAGTKALRLEAALEAAPDGMPIGKIKTLAGRLVGETLEDLIADAEQLFADFASSAPPTEQPKEKLRTASDPEGDAIDAEAIADRIFNKGRI